MANGWKGEKEKLGRREGEAREGWEIIVSSSSSSNNNNNDINKRKPD